MGSDTICVDVPRWMFMFGACVHAHLQYVCACVCVIMYAVCPVKAKLQNVDLSDIYFEGRGQQQSTVYAEGDGEVKYFSA